MNVSRWAVVSNMDNGNRCQWHVGHFLFYSQLSAVETLDQLKATVIESLDKLDLDTFRFISVGMESSRQLSNWLAELLTGYAEHLAYTLVARHAQTRTSPIHLSTIGEHVEKSPLHLDLNDKFLALWQQAADHSLLDTHNVSYKTPLVHKMSVFSLQAGAKSESIPVYGRRPSSLTYLLGDIIANLLIAQYVPYFFNYGGFSRRRGVTTKQV